MRIASKGGKKGVQGHQEGFKGRQADPWAAQRMQLQRMEMGFYEEAEILYQCVVDLSQPTGALENRWRHLMTLRDQLLKGSSFGSHYAPSPTKGKGAGGCKGAKGASKAFAALPAPYVPIAPNEDEETNWKGLLYGEYSKATKTENVKEHAIFEVEEVEEEGKRGGWLARLTLDEQVFEGDVMPNKKAAEKSVCKAAVEYLFPEVLTRQLVETQAKRKKRPLEQPADDPPKQRLAQAIGLLLGRSMMKSDLTFEYQEIAEEGSINGRNAQWIAGVVVVAIDAETCYEGEMCSNKKLAETSACEAALVALAHQIEPLEEEHKAKKARMNREKLDALIERTKIKKSEGLTQVKSEKLLH